MRIFGDQCVALPGTQMMHQLFANSLATMVRLKILKLHTNVISEIQVHPLHTPMHTLVKVNLHQSC